MGATGTFTVDGYVGAGVAIQAKVFNNIAKFEVDIVTAMLKLTDVNGKVMNIAIRTAATMVVTLSAAGGNYTVTLAD